MNNSFTKVLKFVLTSVFLTLTFTSCSYVNQTVKTVSGEKNIPDLVEKMVKRNPSNYKNVLGVNDFDSLINMLVKKSSTKLKRYISSDDVILVSDFVNLDKLKNKSKLGFLLSNHLKNSLLNEDIMIREVELSKEFQYGRHGFNILTREQKDISKKLVDEKFAMVGTYIITTENLIVFIKLIDIENGSILSSATGKTTIDNEILELDGISKRRVIIPHLVL